MGVSRWPSRPTETKSLPAQPAPGGTGGAGGNGVASAGSTASRAIDETAKLRARSQEAQSMFKRGIRLGSASSSNLLPGTCVGSARLKAPQTSILGQRNTALRSAGESAPDVAKTQPQHKEWTL